jgi:rifampin ADP-ribosylating transferase
LTPILFLHGFSLSGATYERTLTALPDGYLGIAVDQRGFGDSDQPESAYTIPEFAADAAALLDALEIPRAVVVGHSFGGLVAQQFAADFPDRVLALVPVGIWRYCPPPKGLGDDVGARIEALRSRGKSPEVFLGRIARYFLAANVTDAERERFLGVAMAAGTTALIETLRSCYERPGLSPDRLASIRVPTLVTIADQDSIVSLAGARELQATIPGAELAITPDSGHSPMWEQPARFHAALFAFLARHHL